MSFNISIEQYDFINFLTFTIILQQAIINPWVNLII